MKKSFLSATLITLAASSASAQIAFESGDITVGYSFNAEDGNASVVDLTARGDYAIGQLGVQLDGFVGGASGDSIPDVTMYSAGGHIYKQFSNGAKAGAYVSYDSISSTFSSVEVINYGVEGMMSFGNIDLEASFGWLDPTQQGQDSIMLLALNAAYEISPSFEVFAGYETYFTETNADLDIYEIGAGYTLGNMPVTVNASYAYITNQSGTDSGVIGVNVGYAFGGSSDEKLFSAHTYPLSAIVSVNP